MNQQKIIQTIKIILTVAVLTIGTSYVLAANWTAPTTAPPTCPNGAIGCDVPVNVGPASQVKLGGLGIGGFFSAKEKAVIGHGTAAPTLVDSLKLRIFGKVGAEAYCDQNGNNCIIPPGGGAGSTTDLWRRVPETQMIENTNNGKVRVNGRIIITGGKPDKDKILTAVDNTGLARWRHISEIMGDTSFVANCPAGKAIQSINPDGTTTCIDIENNTTSSGNGFWLTIIPSIILNGLLNPGEGDANCRVLEGSNWAGGHAPANCGRNGPGGANYNEGTCIDYASGGSCTRRLCC